MSEKKFGKNIVFKIIFWIVLVFWMSLIFYMSERNADESSEMSSPLAIWTASKIIPGFSDMTEDEQERITDTVEIIIRKGGHFTEYAVLGFFMYIVVRMYLEKKKGAFLAWLLSTMYAASDEIHQYFVPGRACMAGDVVIDSSGAFAGIIACILFLDIIFYILRFYKKNQ